MKNVVEITSPRYPVLLKKIQSPPKRLYYKGDWDSEIFKKCLTVVGSRKMTSYGKQITDKLVLEIAASGVTIVSGFMYGIDATAHRAALDAGGRTIAVMPCGIDIIHPGYQKGLYEDILENNGLIISEFEETFPPALWTYPRRNRIMAGLSLATLVIEAGIRSGSLITAEFAKRYNRRLFAVPGPLTSALSQGTSLLIKEGADVVTGSEDILEFYGIKGAEFLNDASSKLSNMSRIEEAVLERLKREPMEIDALSRSIKVSASEVGVVLSLMQLRGILFEERGKYHVK